MPDPGRRVGGLSGPTRRYALIVIMLATMSSLPIIAVLGTGSGTVDDAADPGGTMPFLGQPSTGPVVVAPPPTTRPAPMPMGVAQSVRTVAKPPSEPFHPEPRRRPARHTPVVPPHPTESIPATPPPPPIATPSLTPPPIPVPTPPLASPSLPLSPPPCPTLSPILDFGADLGQKHVFWRSKCVLFSKIDGPEGR